MSSFLLRQHVPVSLRELNLLVSLIVDGDDSAFSDSHGDITVSHREGIVARLGDCRISFRRRVPES
jgi:hypothetical protein